MGSVMGTRGGTMAAAISEALAAIRAGAPGDLAAQTLAAERVLREAVPPPARTVPDAALACVEAAREHLRYGELPEARLLLTEAARLLPVGATLPVQVRARASRSGGTTVTR